MRDILFRGKRKDNGEWVEGYYAKAKHYLTGEEIHVIFPLDLELYPHSEFSSYEEVIPETVGQWTGRCDKNGNKIFEGDIVKYSGFIPCFNCVCVITFNDTCFAYQDADDFRLGRYTPIDDNEYGIDLDGCEIVGNIHDNPELLEQ